MTHIGGNSSVSTFSLDVRISAHCCVTKSKLAYLVERCSTCAGAKDKDGKLLPPFACHTIYGAGSCAFGQERKKFRVEMLQLSNQRIVDVRLDGSFHKYLSVLLLSTEGPLVAVPVPTQQAPTPVIAAPASPPPDTAASPSSAGLGSVQSVVMRAKKITHNRELFRSPADPDNPLPRVKSESGNVVALEDTFMKGQCLARACPTARARLTLADFLITTALPRAALVRPVHRY